MMVFGLVGVALTTLLIPLAQPFALLLAVVLGEWADWQHSRFNLRWHDRPDG